MTKYRLSLVLVVALVLGAALGAQPFSTEVTIAINQLVTGVTPFTALRSVASAYVNWGTTQGTNGYGLRDNAGTIQVKNSGGSWANIVTGSSLPTAASFITRVTESTLSNETAMASLGTGLVINTTATGVPTIYAGATCTNQFPRVLSASGAATCASVSLSADTTGTLTVAKGGTNLASGTAGGVLYYSASTTLASSNALTLNQLMLGGGAAGPSVLGSTGTTVTLLHGNAAGAPTFGAVDLAAEVTGILPGANGGTANGFMAFSGPAASLKTFTLPNASTTILTTNAVVTAAQGGTGIASYTIGDLIYASGATTLSALADAATTNVLISGGVGVAPSWGKVALATAVSGTLGVTNGGTSFASYTVGDILSASGATTLTRVIDVTAGSYLRSGGAAVLPLWSTVKIPNTASTGDMWAATSANNVIAIGITTAGKLMRSAGAGTIPGWSTTIWTNAANQGEVLVASAANTYTNLAVGTAGQLLRSAGAGATVTWTTNVFPNTATQGDLIAASAANTYGNVSDVATGQVLASGGVGALPAYTATPSLTSVSVVTSTNLAAAAGNTVQTLSTATTGDDPTEILRQYRTTTIDGAATTLATIAIPATTSVQFSCAITARRTGGAAGTAEDAAGYLLQVLYKNVAGTATEVAAETLTVIGEDQAGFTAAVSAVGGDAVFTVTGAANNNVTWHMSCHSWSLSS